jgi:uncharacterized protein (TIGR02588 family)
MSTHSGSRDRSPAEWTTLAIVLLILSMLVGLLLWYAVQPTDDAAFEVTVVTSEISEHEGHFYVPLRVLNTGDVTAEDVTVRSALVRDGQTVAEVEMTFRFLAGGEEAEGMAIFDQDPRNETIEAGVTSHRIP